jgi:hypothetical protein
MKYYKPNNSTLLYLNTSYNCIKSSSITLAITTAGSGYTTAPTITFTGATGNFGYGASATATIDANGAITAITFNNHGINYNTLPTITLSNDDNLGIITGYTSLVGGSNYVLPPILSVSNGGGSGFIGYSVLTGTTITSFTITNAGIGYKNGDALIFTGGGGGAGVAATVATISGTGAILTITISNVGNDYTLPPIVSISSTTGTGAIIVAKLSNTSVASIVIINGGKNYTSIPTITFTPVSGSSGSGASCTATIKVGTVAVLTPSFLKTYEFNFNIPDIIINDLGKISTVNIIGNNFSSTTPYIVRIKNILYDSRDTFLSDYGTPILNMIQTTSVCAGQGSVSENNYSVLLPSQIINKITLVIDDDITSMNSGISSAINFVIALKIEEYDPTITEIGNPYQESQRNQGLIHPRLV